MTLPQCDFPADRSIVFQMPSRLELLVVVDQLVQVICHDMDFDRDDTDAIANSVIEAATNAVQHAHGHDVMRPVVFRFLLGDDELQIEVTDTGPGFDLEEVSALDPTGPEGILKSRGRGIFIMKAMMDRVDFDIQMGTGTRVCMAKSRRPAEGGDGA